MESEALNSLIQTIESQSSKDSSKTGNRLLAMTVTLVAMAVAVTVSPLRRHPTCKEFLVAQFDIEAPPFRSERNVD